VVRFWRLEEGHVNFMAKRCEADGCEKQATFGSEAEDLVRFKPHSNDGDVLLRKLRCVSARSTGGRTSL
jgi:hypothetical protein